MVYYLQLTVHRAEARMPRHQKYFNDPYRITSRPASKEYMENYELAFGKKPDVWEKDELENTFKRPKKEEPDA